MRNVALILFCAAAVLRGGLLTPVWVELGEDGRVLARVVVSEAKDCPAIRIDGSSVAMTPRTPVPDGMQPVCEAAIPEGAKSAAVNAQKLALPRPDPSRIVVIGDTGCRIKGDRIQECTDPAKWPLQRVANRAAADKPGLVIHVGDFLYREERCPDGLRRVCGAGPAGDRWDTWAADFFTPAAKLLAAAPWAFSRGNHEDCTRSWKGWFYYLDPRPWTGIGCQVYSEAYRVRLGKFELLMMDTSAAEDTNLSEDQVRHYAAQLEAVHVDNGWLVCHHPFWGVKVEPLGTPPEVLTAPLAEAWRRVSPKGITLVVSGHAHMFELVSFDGRRPPQLIAGDSGTKLAFPVPKLDGMSVGGAAVASGTSRLQFGYTLLTRVESGWNLALKNPRFGTAVKCTIRDGRIACGGAR